MTPVFRCQTVRLQNNSSPEAGIWPAVDMGGLKLLQKPVYMIPHSRDNRRLLHHQFMPCCGHFVPFFVGSNLVAALSGVQHTRPARLAALLAIGIAGRLVLIQ